MLLRPRLPLREAARLSLLCGAALAEAVASILPAGPRLALNILSGMPARDLRGALASGDVARLTRLPGIGRKTSERLILELRERCQRAESAALEAPGAAPETVGRDEEAVSALVNLGYKRADAEKVLRDFAPDVRLEDAIREALRRFAR